MRDYLELTKPRITLLILVCTAVGYWFGCGASFHGTSLTYALLGTVLLASGTSALNQWFEVDLDAKMHRTRSRPLPAGRIERSHGLAFGLLLAISGFIALWFGTNLKAAGLGLLTLLIYLLVYTPLKRRSTACTTVGAIPGAMPTLIGYAAASHGLDAKALVLFLILFIWQFPHFHSIAWMYREDYARAGIRMLAVIDPTGEFTVRRISVCSLLLIPISLMPILLGMSGAVYAVSAVAFGLGVFYFGRRFRRERTVARARALLLATVLYLPVLFSVMLLDRSAL